MVIYYQYIIDIKNTYNIGITILFLYDKHMDIRTLYYFTIVAEELNITKAAKILNMSQPPLSNQMKNLEEELGTPLFIRGKKHITLTDEGKYLYTKSKDILGLVDKTKSDIHNMTTGLRGNIAIGLVEGMAPDIAATWISDSMEKYPNIHFRVIDGNTDELIEKLRSGLISLAVISAPYDETILNSVKVGEEKMMVFINKNHPLSNKEFLTLDDIKNENIVVPGRKSQIDLIKKWFRKIHVEPNIVCEMDNYLDAAALANRTSGVTIFPKTGYVMNSSIVSKEIKNVDNNVEYFFVWRKGHKLSTIEEYFVDYIKTIFIVE